MSALIATITRELDSRASHLVPVSVGNLPPDLRAPARYVIVSDADTPVLRVDVFSHGLDCRAFEETILWRGNLIVGFGGFVHAVSIMDRTVVTFPLESYFGHLYPTGGYLLLASGEALYRMEPDRSLLWQCRDLGVDGVIVRDSGPPIIRGEGEWDPPGGWEPFTLDASNGTRIVT